MTEVPLRAGPEGRDALDRYLAGLSADQLRELVIELVGSVDAAELVEARATGAASARQTPIGSSRTPDRAQHSPAPDDPLVQNLEELVLAAIDDLDPLYEDWGHTLHDSGMSRALDRIEKHLDRGEAAATRPALELAVQELTDLDLDEVDDHYGTLSEALQRSIDLYARACVLAPPEPHDLAQWHLALRLSEPEARAPLADFAPALGEEGLAVYRASLADAEAAAATTALSFQRDAVTALIVELADLDGDVDRAVEALQRGEPDAVGICRRLASAGRDEQAIEWASRAETEGRLAFDPGTERLLDAAVAADCFVRLGRRDEALSLMRRQFARDPAWRSFTYLGSYADRFGLGELERAWARDEARRKAEARNGTGDALVSIALGEGDGDAAWAAADRYGAGPVMMEQIARDTSETHPARAADHFRSRAEAMLQRPDTRVYPHAAALLVRVGQLQAAAGTITDWEAYVRGLRRRYSNRPALRRELDKARLPS